MQHGGKGIYGPIQRSLRRISSYCRYVYLSFDKWEIVPSIRGWSTPWFSASQDNGRRSCEGVAETFSTDSGKNQYAKSTKDIFKYFLGDNMSKNLGLPKGSNSYGNRVPVLAQKKNDTTMGGASPTGAGSAVRVRTLCSEGGQLKTSDEKSLATKSGFELLKDIADGKLNPTKNVYRIICDPEVLKAGYKKLKSNPASMTPGVDGKDLNDLRINEQYFIDLANKLRTESYQPKPTKRVLIPKTGGKTRPLGIPVIEDRIVQQAFLFLLEAVFEKTFNDRSHGFRPNRGAHTACKSIRKWKGISWFVEGELKTTTINHNKLMEIINLKIQDQQISDLLWKFLRAGVIIDKKYQRSKIGVPQDGIISPILSNIYLHSLDVYADELKAFFSIRVKSKLRSKKGLQKRKGYKELRKIKSTIRVGLKLYYIRYADNWLIGVWGSKEDATKIRKKIKIFLKEKLSLELSLEKTKITHAGKEKAQFLGYEIYSPYLKQKKRSSHASIYIDAPYKKLKEQLIKENILVVKNGKWLVSAVTHWFNYNHIEILFRYNWMIRGYLNYYSHVNNLHIFHKIIGFVLRHSCAVTLGRKLKLRSRKKVFKKFGKNLKEPTTKIALAIPPNFTSNTKNYKIWY